MRSIYDNVSVGSIVASYNSTQAVVVTSPATDTKGYNTAVLRVYTSATGAGLGTGAGGSVVAVLQESANNSTWSTANDNTGTAIGLTQEATTTGVLGSARIEGLGLQRLRYLRYTLTPHFAASISSAAIFTCVGVIELGRAYNNPVATTPGGTQPPAVSNT